MTDLLSVPKRSRARVWPWYALAAGLIILDQITKALVRSHFQLHESVLLIGPDLLRFTYVLNPGIAFGVRIFGLTPLILFNGIAAVVLSYYLVELVRKHDPLRWPITLFIAGAAGNGIDRAVFGKVTDFVDCDFPDFIMERWPVFNVADSCVTVGIALLFLFFIISAVKRQPMTSPTQSPEPNDRDSSAETLPSDHSSGATTGTN